MGLRFDPVGGGQFKEALRQIIEAESQPIRSLEARKAREDAKLKLFQDFKSRFGGVDKAIQEISSFKKLRELKVDLGEGKELIEVTIDKDKAQPGTFELEIEEMAARTSVMSNGFENPDDPVLGIGFIVLETESGDTLELFVDDGQSSLRGIADLINRQSNSPVRASVVKDVTDPDEPWKIIITGKKDGTLNSLYVPDFYFMDGVADLYVDYDREARNALVKVDGFPIEVESNDLTDFLPGVNMHIKAAKPGTTFTLTITEDYQKISGKVKTVVDEMNKILEFINKQNQIDEKSDTRTTFAGDTGLQTVEYRLRNLLHEGFLVGDPQGEFRVVNMGDLGIEFGKNGLLTFKEDKFTKFMESDFEGLSQALSGEFGFAFQLREVMKSYQGPGGMLGVREAGLRTRIKQIDDQIDTKTRNIERRTQALTEKFSRLQASLGNLQRQQQYLAATLPGAGGGGNLVQQLLGG